MKLFVWDYVDSLADYGSGEVVSYANNLESAIQLAVDTVCPYLPETTWGQVKTGLEEELRTTDPDVYDNVPFAWVDTGSA